ncbi:unnamed protein product [Arctia plantaginis]|uniref:Uncharacterized protein n=1 Tax=Arctia plantaginis TaxID=874455 RepID=A0A8S1BGN1_ARCPL|nr:unnamed protein product [Arctia plantaginis]
MLQSTKLALQIIACVTCVVKKTEKRLKKSGPTNLNIYMITSSVTRGVSAVSRHGAHTLRSAEATTVFEDTFDEAQFQKVALGS